MPRITSIEGLFGQKYHYDENGELVGESWPGLFEGSWEHYDKHGYAGYSSPGVFSELTHHDANGKYMGDTWQGVAPEQHIHYDIDGNTGDSWDTLTGTDTFFEGDSIF